MSARERASLALALACAGAAAALAENIDPDGDGSQYAWAENAGWINGEPGGDGGLGMQVDDFQVSGFLWGENIGWISLGSGDAAGTDRLYGVGHDGAGVLSGFAWGENAGWVSFSCAGTGGCAQVAYGVTIDPATGNFSGQAWSENRGWISFASDGPHPYRMRTGWTCIPPPPLPSGSPPLGLVKSGTTVVLAWFGIPGATGFDVVRGSLDLLRSTDGDFAAATAACLADNRISAALELPAGPASAGNQWYLVRGVNCGGSGTYDSGGAGQQGSRDAEIASSGHACR
jgi:hypothetical protein